MTNNHSIPSDLVQQQSILDSAPSSPSSEGHKQTKRADQIREEGQCILEDNPNHYTIHLLSIIGEVEGHECLANNLKSTKYEHVLPQLAAIEDNNHIQGLLILINTVGGDVEAGLAIAEMIASLSIPTVSLVLGGSHSIGVPLAVSTNHSFIVPTATMMIHPVRMNGTIIGVRQSYDYFKRIQDRIVGFITRHCKISEKRVLELMTDTATLTRDVGSILVGEQAVAEGIIDEIGGIKEALHYLYSQIDSNFS
ncbi:MAG: ATP-dependent Clp protease proteolytic subunit [Clostridiales bacterium]|nr:ATP-dependent Clp protease proteolytic subunit [Clostridiales bacterium]